MNNYIKQKIRKLILGHDINNYFFSHSGEDAILQNIFSRKLSNKEKGFYIDVGAFHPTSSSNTYLFYINGWTGINIDACPGSMQAFNKTRKKDINLEIGITNSSEELTYYFIDKESSMNSFSKDHLQDIGMLKLVKKEIPVKTYKLSEVLDKYMPKNQAIDFLSIDVEGFDKEVLDSNNWGKYRPKVIVIELHARTLNDVLNNQTTKYLQELNYSVWGKTVILNNISSVIFIDDDYVF